MSSPIRLFLLFSMLITAFAFSATLDHGVLDLSRREFRGEAVAVQGEANLYWGQYLSAEELDTATVTAKMTIPGVWNTVLRDGTPLGATGFGTIALRITADSSIRHNCAILLTPIFSSYRLYIDNEQIIQAGDPQRRPENTISDYKPHLAEFSFDSDTANLIFHIANFTNDQGGPWQPIFVGARAEIHRQHNSHQAYDLFLLGGLLAFVLSYMLAFFMIKHDRARQVSLWFALYTLMLFLRLLCTGTHCVYTLFPGIPSSLVKHVEYLSFFLAPLFYHSYIHLLFSGVSSRRVLHLVRYVTLILSGASLLTPQIIHSYTIMPFQICLLLLLAYHVAISLIAFRREGSKSLILMTTTTILLVTVGHDILQGYGFGLVLPMVPLGGVVVATLHSYFVARNSYLMLMERKRVGEKLEAVNETLSRFVPRQFFTILEESPATITIGKQVRRKMAVAFCDIRNLEAVSAGMESSEKYQLVSAFIREVTPIFLACNGLIDKFIGHSVMVIFPETPDDAMKAALEILEHFHSPQLSASCRELKVGIGIHFGPMTLGVIGAENRMENTVIGDAVNTASRMQSLTHKFDADLIVSNEVLSGGRFENETFHLRSLGTLAVKGKRERTTIQEVFFVNEGENSAKLESRNSFEQGIVFYEAGQYQQAEQLFRQTLTVFPEDAAAQTFAASCRNAGSPILTSK